MRVIGAGGVITRKQEVELELQMLCADGIPLGTAFIENCVFEPTVTNTPLLSGLGVKTRFHTGISPGLLGQLVLTTSKGGIHSIIPWSERIV